jgi:hypothetical protein
VRLPKLKGNTASPSSHLSRPLGIQTEKAAQSAATTQLGLAMMQNAGPCPVQHSAFTPCPTQSPTPGGTASGFSVSAPFVSQRIAVSVTGQQIVACAYQYNGAMFERYYPIGSMCPISAQVQ